MKLEIFEFLKGTRRRRGGRGAHRARGAGGAPAAQGGGLDQASETPTRRPLRPRRSRRGDDRQPWRRGLRRPPRPLLRRPRRSRGAAARRAGDRAQPVLDLRRKPAEQESGPEGNADTAPYSALMSRTKALVADTVLDAYPFASRGLLLDVGGGEGDFAIRARDGSPSSRSFSSTCPRSPSGRGRGSRRRASGRG